MAALFDDAIEIIAQASLDVAAKRIPALHERCAGIAAALRTSPRETVAALLTHVRVLDARVEVDCGTAHIADLLGLPTHADAPARITLATDVRLTRSGRAMKLIQANGTALATTPDTALPKQLVTARRWWAELRRGEIDITVLQPRRRSRPPT